jgi:4-hydroxy-tetrahydrodipicolinate reductase
MLILVLGKGKTGSLVAEVARERGHGVRALDINENRTPLRSPLPISPASTWSSTSPRPRPPSKTSAPSSPSAAASWSAPPAGTPIGRNEGPGQKGAAERSSTEPTSPSACKSSSASRPNWPSSKATILHRRNPPHSKLDAPSGTAITLQQIVEAAQPGASRSPRTA